MPNVDIYADYSADEIHNEISATDAEIEVLIKRIASRRKWIDKMQTVLMNRALPPAPTVHWKKD